MWHRDSIDPSPNKKFLLSFAIRSANSETAEQALLSVSNPLSPTYGQFWTYSEVAAQFLPTPDAIHSVLTWLYRDIEPHDIRVSQDRSWIYAKVSIYAAETLLQAKYHFYRHNTSSEKHLACLNYTLPSSVRTHVDLVTPTTDLGVASLRENSRIQHQENTIMSKSLIKRQTNGLATCSRLTTPACMRELYGIPQAEKGHENNTLGVYQPAWASWLPADLDAFFGYFRPDLIGHRPPIIPINGGYWQDDVQGLPFNAEANLDMQITMSLSAPERVVNF
ncbi:hypothetical protein EKO04_001175 [Ascochyta lentis]|uniref:Peptidase S53 activation domain-containing protein n=1 Tax=Ascochyta lentis TaxID=205686 RepID=A0A8H7JEM4_9PLEO|nr:hypothetical protein EKO04_001175 [Ascochyta lentis]